MTAPIVTPNTAPDPEGDLAFLKESLAKAETPMVKGISSHIDRVWRENQKAMQPVRRQMIDTLRRVRGEYDPEKLAAIRSFQGSEIFIRSGENKARCAESWIKDIYLSEDSFPVELKPTSVSDLPGDLEEQAVQAAYGKAQMFQEQMLVSGVMLAPFEMQELTERYIGDEVDKARQQFENDAKKRLSRALTQIKDWNDEGGFSDAFREFLYWFVRVKFSVLKGPVMRKAKKRVWVQDELSGGYTVQVEDQLVADVYCVSPFNFFASQGMKRMSFGDVIELHELDRKSVTDLIGVPSYDENEVRAVLSEYAEGKLKGKWFTLDDEASVKEVAQSGKRYDTNPVTKESNPDLNETIWAMEFYGSVPGRLLIEWGVEGDIDPDLEYQANCWKIGSHVVKALVNPDPYGRKPYFASSWAKNPFSVVAGEGLIEFAAPVEDALNAITRGIINNIAIASGPMVEEDKDRVPDDTPIFPWKKIRSTSMQMKNDGPAVNFYQPQMHCQELILAYQHFSKILDDMTVPAYVQGAAQTGVTAGTATVFTQLLAAAARSIKAVVSNLDDDVISPYFEMCYDLLMRTTTDETMKGDAQVVAKGVYALTAKEQQAQRKVEFLQVAVNPAYTQILGAKNIGAILAQIARSNDIVLPDMERLEGGDEMEAVLSQIVAAQTGFANQDMGQQAAGGGAPEEPQGTNADGSKAGVNNG